MSHHLATGQRLLRNCLRYAKAGLSHRQSTYNIYYIGWRPNKPPRPSGRNVVGNDVALDAVLSQIRGVLQNLRFGSVTIIVQDGVVVQIDRTEKRRIQPNTRKPINQNRVEAARVEPTIILSNRHTPHSEYELAQEYTR